MKHNFIDLTGRKFDKLTVLSRAENNSIYVNWNCICDCGKSVIITRHTIFSRKNNSCGCEKRPSAQKYKHIPLYRQSSLYRTWSSMKSRCQNPKHKQYNNYGGRGISVCDRWSKSFENFHLDMGEKPTIKHSIDRINNNGNYEPTNCRWATRQEQLRNTRGNRIIAYCGQYLPLSELAEKHNIDFEVLRFRLNRGWDIADAIKVPILKGKDKFMYRRWVLAKNRGDKTDFKTYYDLRKYKF